MRLPLTLPGAGSRPLDVVGVGLNSVDLLAVVPGALVTNSKQEAERFVRLPGGQTATAMVTCARLGWRAQYIGRFGADEQGRFSEASLREAGVDISACKVIPGATNQFAVVLVDSRTGDRTIMWHRHPGLALRPTDVPIGAMRCGRVLLVDCHETEVAIHAVQQARHAGIPTVIDVEAVRPRIAELLGQVDVIIAAEEFPTALTGETRLGAALRSMSKEFRAAMVVATLGAEGSLAIAGGEEIRTPGVKVEVVDTTGAGDVFRGGFIAGWLAAGHEADVAQVLRYANAAAALNCRALGARGGIPSREELERVLQHMS